MLDGDICLIEKEPDGVEKAPDGVEKAPADPTMVRTARAAPKMR